MLPDPQQPAPPAALLCGSGSNSGRAAAVLRAPTVLAPTSLDTSHTIVDSIDADHPHQARVHSRWRAARRHVLARMMHFAPPTMAKRVVRMVECARHPYIVQTDEGELRIAADRCGDRLCPRCSWIRSQQIMRRLDDLAMQMDSPRFLTLTIRSSDEPLSDQLSALLASFRRMRQTKAFKAAVRWGVFTVEITFNARTQQWHPHLHALVDGRYWAQAEISAAWEKASRGSPIVDIRRVDSRAHAARYLAKYMCKADTIKELPDAAFQEFVMSIRGLRMINVFGDKSQAKYAATRPPPANVAAVRLVSLAVLDREKYWARSSAIGVLTRLKRSANAIFQRMGNTASRDDIPDTPPEPSDVDVLAHFMRRVRLDALTGLARPPSASSLALKTRRERKFQRERRTLYDADDFESGRN